MKYLVDANVLSEPTKSAPSLKVIEWLTANEAELAVDPIIVSEIRLGIELLPSGKRRQRFEEWFNQGISNLVCIPIDAATGIRWAHLVAQLQRSGKTMQLKDSLIAATALVHGLTVATRNVRDFRAAGTNVENPFE
jgi:predicted nucleic acid-binding protein